MLFLEVIEVLSRSLALVTAAAAWVRSHELFAAVLNAMRPNSLQNFGKIRFELIPFESLLLCDWSGCAHLATRPFGFYEPFHLLA
jgi:hypothetical protein